MFFPILFLTVPTTIINHFTAWKRDKPRGKDFENYKGFRSSWVRRWCRRWKVSLQKRTNRKSATFYNRLHIINAYHRKLIYQVQDPNNFKDDNTSWISKKWYVDNHRSPERNEDDEDNADTLIRSESDTSHLSSE